MTTPWQQRYAQRMKWMGSSIIRELLKLTERPDIISFAGGLPAAETFPVAEFKTATQEVLTQHGSKALQYSTTEGYPPLREYIVQRMARYGITAAPENVLITSGSQQALDVIGKVLINPGDQILTEQPTYVGALQAWKAYQAEFVTVPVDEYGLCTSQLEEAVCCGPKFMYILPNFQNPAGVTLTLPRRQKLLALADQYGIPIIEDDPYGQLRYEGEHLPPLVVLDNEQLEHRAHSNGHGFMSGNVIYISTFSKILSPGLRLGWMVAPQDVISRCVMAKQGMDLHTSSFVQMVAHEVIKDGFIDGHVQFIRQLYRQRRDVMLAALEREFPPGIEWTRPAGGLFLWVTLPPEVDTTLLLEKAIVEKVAYVPGSAFDPSGGSRNTFRLNFSNARPEEIETGIRRLARVIERALSETEAPAPIVTDVQLVGTH
jgi:2-aminoadipate transaminase